jgi:ribosomal protein L23
MPVSLFPNWVVKLVRNPNLRTRHWLDRPVEVFHVSPKMTKFEIKEYLTQLYNLPVSHVHTAIYEGKKRMNRQTMRAYQEADYKKAYVYLHTAETAQGSAKTRYHLIEEQLSEASRDAWPVKPHRVVDELVKKGERGEMPPRDRNAARQKKVQFRPYDLPFPDKLPE